MTNKDFRLGAIMGTARDAYAATKMAGRSLLLRGCDSRGSRMGHNTIEPQMKSQIPPHSAFGSAAFKENAHYHLAGNILGEPRSGGGKAPKHGSTSIGQGKIVRTRLSLTHQARSTFSRGLKILGVAFAIGVGTVSVGIAETTPRAGKHDTRVRYVTHTEGQVYRIYTRVKHATLIEFDKGEIITTVPLGDSKSFLVEEIASKNALMVKPLIKGARTNAIVETNRRFYILDLYESASRVPFYAVRFTVPERAKKSKQTAPSGFIPYTYRIEKTKTRVAFRPQSVWDDGRKTTFTFGPDAPIPAIFRADAEGREYSVNTRTTGTTVTVARRAERWVLRHGDEFVCITANTGGVQ